MERNGLNILGLGEVRGEERGNYWSGKHRVIFSGGEKDGERGVAIILDAATGKRVKKVVQCNERMILVKIEAEPVDTVLIQVYMPTSASEEEEVDKVYEQIEELMVNESSKNNLIIMGDWNAVIGEGKDGRVVGAYGLGTRNERGEKLFEFCETNKLQVTNTYFQQAKRRRCTWKMPGDRGRYQLDYIIVRQRYSNSVKKSCSYPGADVGSDHNLVMVKIRVKLKVLSKKTVKRKWDLEQLKENVVNFQNGMNKRLEKASDVESIDKLLTRLKTSITESAS